MNEFNAAALSVLVVGLMAVANLFVRELRDTFEVYELLIFQFLVIALLFSPFLKGSVRQLARDIALCLPRSAMTVGSVAMFYIALTNAPLSAAIAAFFTHPIITYSLNLLHERARPTAAHIVIFALCSLGVWLMLYPVEAHPYALFAVGTAFVISLRTIFDKVLLKGQMGPARLQGVTSLILGVGSLFCAPFLLTAAVGLTASDLISAFEFSLLYPILIGISQIVLLHIVRQNHVATFARWSYLELPITTGLAYVVLHESLSFLNMIGAGLIVLTPALFLLTPRKSKR